MRNNDVMEGRWKLISGRIRRLWAERFDDYDEAIRGNLTEIAGILQTEFGLVKEEARLTVARWRQERQPEALLEEQWKRFNSLMQDRWTMVTERFVDGADELEGKRRLVIRDIEELMVRLQQRYTLSQDMTARQINDWLSTARSWIDRHATSQRHDQQWKQDDEQ